MSVTEHVLTNEKENVILKILKHIGLMENHPNVL